ncbi:CCD17 protein, partial [Alectura lathami]|nr:CCD17 protein [Alectura lathami]
ALRQSYLHGGGRDEAILAQLLDLQLEAMALEKRAERRTGWDPVPTEAPLDVLAERPEASTQGLDAALLAVELENRRLEDKLLALKVRRERRADAGSLVARQHTEELAQLQAEVGMLLQQQVEGAGSWLPPAILPPPVAPPLP